jgi:hypothetical protein
MKETASREVVLVTEKSCRSKQVQGSEVNTPRENENIYPRFSSKFRSIDRSELLASTSLGENARRQIRVGI